MWVGGRLHDSFSFAGCQCQPGRLGTFGPGRYVSLVLYFDGTGGERRKDCRICGRVGCLVGVEQRAPYNL